MALEFTDIPVRRWRAERTSPQLLLTYTKNYDRVMGLIGRAIAAGGAVEADVRICERPEKGWKDGDAYDVMTVRIDMPKGVPLPATAKPRKRGQIHKRSESPKQTSALT